MAGPPKLHPTCHKNAGKMAGPPPMKARWGYRPGHMTTKRRPPKKGRLLGYRIRSGLLLACEEVFLFAGIDKLLREDVSSGLGGLVHTDALNHAPGA